MFLVIAVGCVNLENKEKLISCNFKNVTSMSLPNNLTITPLLSKYLHTHLMSTLCNLSVPHITLSHQFPLYFDFISSYSGSISLHIASMFSRSIFTLLRSSSVMFSLLL